MGKRAPGGFDWSLPGGQVHAENENWEIYGFTHSFWVSTAGFGLEIKLQVTFSGFQNTGDDL